MLSFSKAMQGFDYLASTVSQVIIELCHLCCFITSVCFWGEYFPQTFFASEE